MAEAPDRNLALELVRVTEAAALACARWVGFGDKISADRAAVDAMRHMLATVEMDGVVVKNVPGTALPLQPPVAPLKKFWPLAFVYW